MPPKRSNKPEKAEKPSPREKTYFWGDKETANPANDEKKRLSEQISRLQQRQLELVQQTAAELEELKQQVENTQDKEPLLQEIATLRGLIQSLQTEKEQLHSQLQDVQQDYHSHQTKMQAALSSLKDALESAEIPADRFELKPVAPVIPVVEVPVAPPPVQHTEEQPVAAVIEERIEVPSEPKAKRFSVRRFAVRMVTAAMVIGAGTWGYLTIEAQREANIQEALSGQVAGVTTESVGASQSVEAPTIEEYKESQVDLPFAATEWAQVTDNDFGVSLQYPKNTSNKVRTIGGSNLWFLRKDGYYMKFTKSETELDLAEWWDQNKSHYIDYSPSEGSFKGEDAMVLKSNPGLPAGTLYIIKRPTMILEIWVKEKPDSQDDKQRIDKMVESLEFLEQ